MPTATSPLPPAIQEAVVEVSDGIVVTLEVEQVRLSKGHSTDLAQEPTLN